MQGTQASREFWKQGVRSGLLVYTVRLESWGQREQFCAVAASWGTGLDQGATPSVCVGVEVRMRAST
jgi:hypothetical protein